MQAATAFASRSPRVVSWSRMGDESLAGRAAAGDQDAFTALYERYHGALLSYCRSILLNDEDAHDATQNALENALRALPRREPGRALKPWLYRIAHNEAINIVRRRQPVASGIDTDDLLSVPGPEVASEQRTRLAQLVDDLRMLPERQRGALVMRELSGLSYDDIGLALGVSNEAARRAVFDARTALHDAVDGRATECVSVRRCLSDGDRRRLRARGMRAHLRSCDDCATFQRAIGARQADLHLLGPFLGGAGALGLLGLGAGASGGAGAIFAAAGGGGAAATAGAGAGAGGLGWAGLPVAVKGFAVAAVVATTGTAAVELPKVTQQGSPARSSVASTASAASAAPAISPLHNAVREQAQAQAAEARRARDAAAARERARDDAALTVDRREPDGTPIVHTPAAPPPAAPAAQAPPSSQPSAPRTPAHVVAKTPEQIAAAQLQRIREQILAAFQTAQQMAAPGTQSALADANALIASTLSTLSPLLDNVLATVGLTLPSSLTAPPPATPQSGATATNVLAPVQSLLGGVDGMLNTLFGRR